MAQRDTSSVYNIDMLDAKHRAGFDPSKPWIFETGDDDAITFATEEEACAVQRTYRLQFGFDPVTGETRDFPLTDEQRRSLADWVDKNIDPDDLKNA